MRKVITGDRIAQLQNRDPFAAPVWRAPIYETPGGIIVAVQLARLIGRLIRFIARHPFLDLAVVTVAVVWNFVGWWLLAVLAGTLAVALALWWWRFPASFGRYIGGPARARWRAFQYRRRWAGVMTIGRLAPFHQGRILLPVLDRVQATPCTDRVQVRLVSGQSAKDFADRADNLAHGFGALLCRVRTGKPGTVVLEFVRRDALAAPIPALPVGPMADLRALPVGMREDGLPWLIRLHGTHVLIAGATGAGKGSVLWSIVRGLLPWMHAGLVRVLAADPKLMELAYGRAIFDRYGAYAADPGAIVAMLEDQVTVMQARAARYAGHHRHHTPTAEDPFVVILVDEVAFLTAYQRDRDLRNRTLAALATLTTQGRAVGFAVVAALQDPRKDVLAIRNLFPDRIVMRLDEPDQADMVLGDGARDRGATADLISPDPATGAGVAFVRLETDPDPVRVRASWVTDPDIKAMADHYGRDPMTEVPAIETGAAQ